MTLKFVLHDSIYLEDYSYFNLDLFLKNGMWEARCGWKLYLPEAELGEKQFMCTAVSEPQRKRNTTKMNNLSVACQPS